MKKEQSQASLALPVIEVTTSHSIEQNEIKDEKQDVITPDEQDVKTPTYPIWTPTAFDEFSIV